MIVSRVWVYFYRHGRRVICQFLYFVNVPAILHGVLLERFGRLISATIRKNVGLRMLKVFFAEYFWLRQ